jgi:hypothetical protein
MAVFNKFNTFVEDVAEKVHNLGADVLKIVLSSVAPVATNTILANITQIAAGNGYVAGGSALTVTSSAQTAGLYKLVANDLVFTAAGGPIASFRYATLYNDTPTSPVDPLIGWWDYGAAVVLADTETFTVDLDQTNGVLTLQ